MKEGKMRTFVGGYDGGGGNCIFGGNPGGGAVIVPSVTWQGVERKVGNRKEEGNQRA